MDASQFDELTTSLAAVRTRRGALRLFAGGLVAWAAARMTGATVYAAQISDRERFGCLENQEYCPFGGCADLSSDLNNCGACNRVCRWPYRCITGVCTILPPEDPTPERPGF